MTPDEILQGIHEKAAATLNASVITDPAIMERVDYPGGHPNSPSDGHFKFPQLSA